MSKFAFKKINAVKGKISIYKLLVNGFCEFDDFCEEVSRTGHKKNIMSILTTLNSHTNLFHLPPTRFKELTGRKANDLIKDYEVKSDGYRVYLFKHKSGKIVVFGGSKDNQTKDIARLRAIKLEVTKED